MVSCGGLGGGFWGLWIFHFLKFFSGMRFSHQIG
jgi:hypothetical protein